MTTGRLVCDAWLGAKELVKENDYSLAFLCKKYLNKDRLEINDEELIIECFKDSKQLLDMVDCLSFDSQLTFELMNKLEILPLTKQLTNIAGNTWIKSLQNARAERNEMLLMHEFYKHDYIIPDKFNS